MEEVDSTAERRRTGGRGGEGRQKQDENGRGEAWSTWY
jgi:hypothetical protein